MHLTLNENECTGCAICANICPKRCISMKSDNEGFLHPVIDYTECIDCMQCDRHCPILNKNSCEIQKPPLTYAAWSLDDNVRYESTSGGIFTELATAIISNGGYVAGARYDEDFNIVHCIIKDKSQVQLLRQSKYAQSDKKDIFSQIRNLLLEGNTVVFCGTPCECAGLQMFRDIEKGNLILLDFICLGVNSPAVYDLYKNYLEKKYGSKIVRMWFKNKKFGWNRFSTFVEFENGKTYSGDRYNDLFMRGYLEQRLYLRSACYECKFKSLSRIADVSLGDFWGIGEYKKELDTNLGTSLVMVNTEKGAELFNLIKKNIFFERVPTEIALRRNPAILNSAVRNKNRDRFFVDSQIITFDKLISKYCGATDFVNGKRKIRLFLSGIKKRISNQKEQNHD